MRKVEGREGVTERENKRTTEVEQKTRRETSNKRSKDESSEKERLIIEIKR